MTEARRKPTAISASQAANEAGRLEALCRYNILDTPPEVAFDRITSLAARLFNVPISLVSLVDRSRVWFKSAYGFDLKEVQRDTDFCDFTQLSDDVLVVPDTLQDERFSSNSFVQNEPGLRFYAGASLITQDGFNLGTLCLLDTQPRENLSNDQKAALRDLAAMVVDELELRLAAHKIAQIDAALLEVTQGVSTVTGEAFFSALVQHFARVLGTDYTYIGLVNGDELEAIETTAVCAHQKIIDNFAYLLRDTPCQEVLRQRKLCCYPKGVQGLFPNAPLLAPLKVESYVAVPFFDSTGKPLGLLGVMDSKPLQNLHLAETLLPSFALRIATELERQQAQLNLERLVEQRTRQLSKANQLLQLEVIERQQAETALQQDRELLKVLLDNVQAGIVACNAEGILTLFNRAAQEFHGLPEQPLPPEQWAEYYDLYRSDGKTRMTKAEIPLFRAFQGEIVENVEMVIAPKQGTPRTLVTSGRAIADAQGKKQGAVAVMHDITERKQAEAELRISDAALQQMPDAVLLIDLEGKVQRWLGNAEQIFGYTAAEAIGKPVSFLYHADINQTMLAQIIESIKEIGSFYGEVPCLRKDGSTVPIETTSKIVYDKAGTPVFFVGINKDITERKQAEAGRAQLIREQAARLEAEADHRRSAFLAEVSTVLASALDYERTLDTVANLVVPFFADWCVIDVLQENQSLERMAVAHRDPEKVKFAWEMHRKYPRRMDGAEGVPKVLRTGQTEIAIEIPDRIFADLTQDPEYLQILRELGLKSYIVSPLIARGQILGAISFVMAESQRRYSTSDVSLAKDIAHRAAIALDNARLFQEAQQAQQAAERSAERITRLQSVTAAFSESLTPDQVAEAIVDQGMAALGANCAIFALLNEPGTELEIVQSVGYNPNQLEGWKRFPLDAPVPLAEAVRSGQPIWAESSERRAANYPHLAQKYEQHHLESWISIPLIVEGRALGGISFGFTAPQQLQEEQQAFILSLAQQCAQAIARTHLYEAERIARSHAESANRVKDEFLAVLSHELRTPLNPILGWAKLLQAGNLDRQATQRALETIERNAKLQTQLIEDLLDVSRILSGKMSLNTCTVNLVAVIQSAIETVQLAAEVKQIEIKTVFASGSEQVFGDPARLQQIVWNLLSNAIKFTPPGGRMEVRLDRVGSQAEIQVKDTGKGMNPDFLPYAFECFRQEDGTTTRRFGGLGLGLAIVRHLSELHGGTVAVESAGEGLGSTFKLRIPLLEATLELSQTLDSHAQEIDLTGIRVLVVDDEADMRDLAQFVLEHYGAEVMSAASALEALAAFDRFHPDVLISDIGMPVMDGYQFMRQVRDRSQERGGEIPAIALTAYAGEPDRQQALDAGFQYHISKPVEPAELAAHVASLIGVKQQQIHRSR